MALFCLSCSLLSDQFTSHCRVEEALCFGWDLPRLGKQQKKRDDKWSSTWLYIVELNFSLIIARKSSSSCFVVGVENGQIISHETNAEVGEVKKESSKVRNRILLFFYYPLWTFRFLNPFFMESWGIRERKSWTIKTSPLLAEKTDEITSLTTHNRRTLLRTDHGDMASMCQD